VIQYAETLLGGQNYIILCMDQSNCKEPFPEIELERVLPPKLLDLYYRIRQRKEIAAAGLENLEECPFCDFKYVIENPEEKLFRCQNEECRAITCRACKKPVSGLLASCTTNGANIYLGPSTQVL
jgi:E3 ubiquitin-protein ligase RNF216